MMILQKMQAAVDIMVLKVWKLWLANGVVCVLFKLLEL